MVQMSSMDSSDTVGDDSYSFVDFPWVFLSAHDLPLIILYLFSLINIKDSNALSFCSVISRLASIKYAVVPNRQNIPPYFWIYTFLP